MNVHVTLGDLSLTFNREDLAEQLVMLQLPHATVDMRMQADELKLSAKVGNFKVCEYRMHMYELCGQVPDPYV